MEGMKMPDKTIKIWPGLRSRLIFIKNIFLYLFPFLIKEVREDKTRLRLK
jgi:hypothetical protein|tara:strand:+ start:193 stop:342 length:150 start_codon:yes stop_codon:yes gene_type:complete